jgi:DNA repair exonuclease
MAGDLYDRAIPPKEAVSLANKTFTKITQELNIPMLVIAGNHDSNERVEYGSELLATGNLFIEGTTKETIRKVRIKNTNFYLLPYDDHRNIRRVLKDESIRTPEDALKAQLEVIAEGWNEEELNVLLYHGFVMNTKADELPEESESERPLTVGTVEYSASGAD